MYRSDDYNGVLTTMKVGNVSFKWCQPGLFPFIFSTCCQITQFYNRSDVFWIYYFCTAIRKMDFMLHGFELGSSELWRCKLTTWTTPSPTCPYKLLNEISFGKTKPNCLIIVLNFCQAWSQCLKNSESNIYSTVINAPTKVAKPL